MTISVGLNHIEAGVPCNCYTCPIARATAETLNLRTHDLSIGAEYIWILHENSLRWKKYKLPPECRAFIRAFDNRGDVVPFSFELIPF